MSQSDSQIIVAGHVCLDVIPEFDQGISDVSSLFRPGGLVGVGPALTATGGPVSNTGLALHRLGVPTRLMGKIGDDLFGHAIMDLLSRQSQTLAGGMMMRAGEATSYSLVISPPGVDRFFYHCTGANDTFGAADVDLADIGQERIFHFGYPPLMRRMYQDDGAELATLMERVRSTGITTSLDMSTVDPASEAGRADWGTILERTLPHVDVFLPSFDETLFMLDRPSFDDLTQAHTGNLAAASDIALLRDLAGRLLAMGTAVVALKLGDQGLYVRTALGKDRILGIGRTTPADPSTWVNRELLSPCFATDVVGTTGAGDCTIAGFLTAMLKGQSLSDVMTGAVAVGAFNTEAADATSGIAPWADVQTRIAEGWDRLPLAIDLPGWRWIESPGIFVAPDNHTVM